VLRESAEQLSLAPLVVLGVQLPTLAAACWEPQGKIPNLTKPNKLLFDIPQMKNRSGTNATGSLKNRSSESVHLKKR